jgi:hypothetical protein
MSEGLVLGMEQIRADRSCEYKAGRGIMEAAVISNLACIGILLH